MAQIDMTLEQSNAIMALLAKQDADNKRLDMEREKAARDEAARNERVNAKNASKVQRNVEAKTTSKAPTSGVPEIGEKLAEIPAIVKVAWHELTDEERYQRSMVYRAMTPSLGKRAGEGPNGRIGTSQNVNLALQHRREDEEAAINALCGYSRGEPHGVQLSQADLKVSGALRKHAGTLTKDYANRSQVKGYVPGVADKTDLKRRDLVSRRALLLLEEARAALLRDEEEKKCGHTNSVLWGEREGERLIAFAKLEQVESDLLELG